MLTGYELWCENNYDISNLIRRLHSSKPEEYLSFYLSKFFENDIEYQKRFPWLGTKTLDIYIPSLKLAVEYDGIYYHYDKKDNDKVKNRLCRSNDIRIVRIYENGKDQKILRNANGICYYPDNDYRNIDVAIQNVCLFIQENYNIPVHIDVDIDRDMDAIISYIQFKFHQKTVAYVWPESVDYWSENNDSAYDVLSTSNQCYTLKCPHCGREYHFHMRYFHNRKSIIPCSCENKETRKYYEEVLADFVEKKILVKFDDSLRSRRMYDYIAQDLKYISCLSHKSRQELEMYQQLGFDSPMLDYVLRTPK